MKVGDWVIHDYEIKQVIKMDGNRIVEVSCGSFSTSGYDLECRPLTLRAKRYAESFEYFYKRLNEMEGSRALNWPDIHRHFCKLTMLAIDCPEKKYQDGEMNPFVKEGEDFVTKTRDQLSSVKSVSGVRLFK